MGLLGLGLLGGEHRLARGGQTGQALELAGDDDLGGLSVGRGLEGLQGLDLDDALPGGGLVDELDGVGGGLLHLQDGLGLGLGLQDLGLLGALGLEDGRLLGGIGLQDGGLLLDVYKRQAL